MRGNESGLALGQNMEPAMNPAEPPSGTEGGRAANRERSSIDDIIELYMADVDQTLLIENLKLTPEERLNKLACLQEFAEELRRAGQRLRGEV